MNDPTLDLDAQADVQVRLCKIIAGALIGGVTMFLAMVVSLRVGGGKGFLAAEPWNIAPPRAIISLIGLAMAAMMMTMAPIVARLVTASLRAKMVAGKPVDPQATGTGRQGELRLLYQMRMIIVLAMIEGATFFNLIAFLLEGKLPNLIAALVLIALMVVRFPTRGSVEAFVDDQSDFVQQGRHSA